MTFLQMHGLDDALRVGLVRIKLRHELLNLLEGLRRGFDHKRAVVGQRADGDALAGIGVRRLLRVKLCEHRGKRLRGIALERDDMDIALRARARLLEHVHDGRDLREVIRTTRRDEATVRRVGDELRVGGIASVLALPTVGVELHHERLQSRNVVGLAKFKQLRLTRTLRERDGLQVADDALQQLQLRLAAGENELVARGVLHDEDVRGAEVGLARKLIVVKLPDLRRKLHSLALLERDDLDLPFRLRSERAVELLDNGGRVLQRLQFLRVTRHDDRARLRVHRDTDAAAGPAEGVVAQQCVAEHFHHLGRVGGLELEEAHRAALAADLVELLDDLLDGVQLVRRAGNDEAVGARVGQNQRLLRLRGRTRLRLVEIQRLHRRGQLGGVGGGKFVDARVAGSAQLGRAQLRHDAFNLREVIRAARDDEPAVLRINDQARVRRVAGVAVLPAVLVKLLHERLQAVQLIHLAGLDELRLALAPRGERSLEVAENLFHQHQLRVAAGKDELVARGVLHDEDVAGAQFRLGRELVVVELAELGGEFGHAALLERHHLHLSLRLRAERLVELLDDGRDADQFLRVARHDERAGLGIDAHGRALLRPAVGIETHERGGEDFGNLQGIGGLEFEHARGGALRADLVELPDDGFDGVEFVGFAHDDEAVAARVGRDERVGCLRAEAGLRLFEVKRADSRRELDGAGGGQVKDARLAHVAARFRRAGAELREDALNVLQVFGLARDDEASGLRVGKNLRVRRVGLGLLLPLLGVKLLHERLQPQHVRRAADLEGARLTSRLVRGGAGLEPGEDVFNHLHLIGAGADDELSRLTIGKHLGVGRASLRRVGELVAVELLRNRHQPGRFGEPAQIKRLRLARRTGLG